MSRNMFASLRHYSFDEVNMDLCIQRQCQLGPDGHFPYLPWLSRFLDGWRCWLWFFLFVGGWKMKDGEVERKSETDRQTEWVYWLVPSSSVDCDKFICGNPLKADASPDQPPSSSLPLLFCPSALLSAADLWGQISHVCYLLRDIWGLSFCFVARLQ